MSPKIDSMAPMLSVKNARETVAYYCDRLGFETVFIAESDTLNTYAAVSRDGYDIHFLEDSDRPSVESRCGINVYVDDVDGLYEEFKKQGAFHEDFPRHLDSIREHPPENKEYGLRDFIFADPNGYILVFGQEL